MESPRNLKELIEHGYAFPALLPEKNDFLLTDKGRDYRAELVKRAGEPIKLDSNHYKGLERGQLLDLSRLDELEGYTVPLVAHDYGAKTPIMWNKLYEKLGLKIRNIMLVASPEDAEVITRSFREDPKYLGGGFGVGFKEKLGYVDEVVPADLASINIVVKKNGELVGYNTDARGFVRSLEDKFREIRKDEIEGKNIVILGAGGVAKEVARLIAEKGARRIVILNRTIDKAVEIAYELNQKYRGIANAGGEEIIRGYLLNSFIVPDAVVNLTDKGSDGAWVGYAAFADTVDLGHNISMSRTIARELARLNPEIVVADIVLPKKGKPITLRVAENEGLKNLIDGVPMVVNQAAPAYIFVQNANPDIHKQKVTEEEALEVFREAAR